MNLSSTRPLHVAWCDTKAAKFAVENWHYSAAMPNSRVMCLGVWEHSVFKGSVVFGKGANNNIGSPYGLLHFEVCELRRVALRAHAAPVSKILSICLRHMRKECPLLRLIVSYADSAQGHHGGIYQAGNWLYMGPSTPQSSVMLHGKLVHKKGVSKKYGHCSVETLRRYVDPNVRWVNDAVKHTYAMPLDMDLRNKLTKKAQRYPKRATSIGADAPGFQPGEGGSQPTVALQSDAQKAELLPRED